VEYLFEHGYAKESAGYFQAAGNSFRTMLKKVPHRSMLNIRTNGEYSHKGDAVKTTIPKDFKIGKL